MNQNRPVLGEDFVEEVQQFRIAAFRIPHQAKRMSHAVGLVSRLEKQADDVVVRWSRRAGLVDDRDEGPRDPVFVEDLLAATGRHRCPRLHEGAFGGPKLAIVADVDGIRRHLRHIEAPKRAGVHEGEMRQVEEVLDHALARRGDPDAATLDKAPAGRADFGYVDDVARRLAQADPHKIVADHDVLDGADGLASLHLGAGRPAVRTGFEADVLAEQARPMGYSAREVGECRDHIPVIERDLVSCFAHCRSLSTSHS